MKMQLLLTVFIWLSSCLTLIADDVILQSAEREGPVHYGSVQLEQALTAHGYRVVTSTTGTPFVIELKTIGEGLHDSTRTCASLALCLRASVALLHDLGPVALRPGHLGRSLP